ncbi:alpha/beta hydrolase [Formosa sp. L2A11]|uniref:alpha/beta hydrolase n=1 Tax=Formosa sp. L2A11 TaxID=2686363 RepID=UPI00131D706F|nr:dienelactone hydrolase family protein [Formosa sp. L2A11]
MKYQILFILLVCTLIVHAQEKQFNTEDLSITNLIDGTLLTPLNTPKPNLAIIIGGSGPTDRDGNQSFLKNNSLKKLAQQLTLNNIASFRYDKRIVKQLKHNNIDKSITFDDFISDAKDVLDYFKSKNTFNKIYVIGHSQGSLIGMIISKDKADGYISISGPGEPIDQVIIQQLTTNAPMYLEDSKKVFAILKTGQTTTDFPAALASIFNIDVQPFISNWMSYNPQEEIKKLKIPILIINGTKDLQVKEEDANKLKAAAPQASIKLIKNMNHIFATIEGESTENSKSYNEPEREIAPELVTSIVQFIQNNK